MSDEEQTVPDPVIEPALPGLELPSYHGRKPSGMKSSITGSGNRVTTEHEIDSRVVFVIEAKVKKAGHEQTDDGLLYAESYSVVDLFEVPGKAGTKLLSTVRQAYRTADDEVKGRAPLPGLGEGATDASGVVLTPEELAAAQGVPMTEPADALDPSTPGPVVVLYSDGAREIWPEEFPSGEPRPEPGARFILDDLPEGQEPGPTDYVFVEKLLDVDTGETVAEWTAADEDARLEWLEKELEEQERSAEAGPPEADEAPSDGGPFDEEAPVAYYRIEFPNGAVAEEKDLDQIHRDDLKEASRIVEIRADGTELELERPAEGWTRPKDEPAEVSFAGDAPDEELELDDDGVGFVEDEDGFASPVLPEEAHFRYIDRKETEIRNGSEIVKDGAPAGAHVALALIGTSGPGTDADRAALGRDFLLKCIVAEENGRGRGLKPRKGILELLSKRAAELFSGLDAVPEPGPPADPDDFDPDGPEVDLDETEEVPSDGE